MELDSPITLLKKAFSLYWRKLGMLLPLGLIVFIVGLVQVFSTQTSSVMLGLISSIVGVIIFYVSYLAIMRAVSSPVAMHVGELFVSIERYIVPSAIVSGLVILVALGGFLFLIVPGIMALVYLSFAIFAVVVDQYEKRDALTFSWHLVRGRWWGVFLRFLIANIVIALIVLLIMVFFWLLGVGETPIQTIVRVQQGEKNIPVSQLILSQAVSNFFTTPLTLCFVYVLYEALKRTVALSLEEVEKTDVNWYIRTFSIIGTTFLIVSILVSGFFIAKFLPELVKATHTPAAVFSIF